MDERAAIATFEGGLAEGDSFSARHARIHLDDHATLEGMRLLQLNLQRRRGSGGLEEEGVVVRGEERYWLMERVEYWDISLL